MTDTPSYASPFRSLTATPPRIVPALVLSDRVVFNAAAGHSVMAMITSQANPPWPLDRTITDLAAAGPSVPSRVRFKVFTLDHRLVRGQIGRLAPVDAELVSAGLAELLGR